MQHTAVSPRKQVDNKAVWKERWRGQAAMQQDMTVEQRGQLTIRREAGEVGRTCGE